MQETELTDARNAVVREQWRIENLETARVWALTGLLYLFASNEGIPRPQNFLIDSFLACRCRISNIFHMAPVFVLLKVMW